MAETDRRRAIAAEIADRITAALEARGGAMPPTEAAAWQGYLAALIEWDLISVPAHDRLYAMLPEVEGRPAGRILLGVGE